jgi:hypothetical protein
MRRRFIFILLFLVFSLCFIFFSNSVAANGGFFIDFDEHILIPSQKAVIFWDGTTEEMILSTKFTSDTIEDKAWVVPIQSSTDPEVTEGEIDVFFDSAESFGQGTSKPHYGGYLECFIIGLIFFILGALCLIYAFVKRDTRYFLAYLILAGVFLVLCFIFFFSYIYVGGLISAGDSDVEVIEVKKVDIYDVAILKANDSSSLINWCEENEFYVSSSANDIIDEYCNQENFYFVINKINLSNVYNPDEYDYAIENLEEGIETPLKFRFRPDKPFYPQKMTSINEGDTKINLYFVTNKSYYDDSEIFSVKEVRSNYYGYFPKDFERSNQIAWFTYEGSVKDLTEDSYFEEV